MKRLLCFSPSSNMKSCFLRAIYGKAVRSLQQNILLHCSFHESDVTERGGMTWSYN